MKKYLLVIGIILMVMNSSGQSADSKKWWPNKLWGEGDQAGASNWITPDKVLQAISMVKKGTVYELGHEYVPGMPISQGRTYSITTVGNPTLGPWEENKYMMVANDEFICGQLGQIGTQFDALAHPGIRVNSEDGGFKDIYYNGITSEQMRPANNPYGFAKLGVENVRSIITKGILIDIAGYKRVETLPRGYQVTLQDVYGAMKEQRIDEESIQKGDAIFVNYGISKLWDRPDLYSGNGIGISTEVAEWMVDKNICLFGEDGGGSNVHGILIVKNGIYMLENMDFQGLIDDDINRFLFIVTPLRLKGAAGSPVRPIAVY